MANKITETVSLKITGPSFSATMSGTAITDQSGSHYTEQTQIISVAAPEQLDIAPDITEGSLGYLLVRNMGSPPAALTDPENVVDIATDEGMENKIATVRPGKGAFIPPPEGTVVFWAKAALADVTVIFLAVEK